MPTHLVGYEFFELVLKSPKYVVAPMVDQSELAWRILSRRYGAQLCYTPMLNARLFAESQKYRDENFSTNSLDRPLIVQFCANDPHHLLKAAVLVQNMCDAVDINLGCPQDIARRGHYGSYLQDEWSLIESMVKILCENICVPVTAKIRIFPDVEKSIRYAKMIEAAGVSLLTVHGRVREQRGHNSGLADWSQIKRIRENVSIPVFANGNILYFDDIETCLLETGANGVMSAEGNLFNPAIFTPELPFVWDLVNQYLDICKNETSTSISIIRGHLFKLFRYCLSLYTDLRTELGKASSIECIRDVSDQIINRLKSDHAVCTSGDSSKITDYEKCVDSGIKRNIPHWRPQPYIRPLLTRIGP